MKRDEFRGLKGLTAIVSAIMLLALSAKGQDTIVTVAGNGSAGYSGDGGAATAAQLSANTQWSPNPLALDSAGNLYIADITRIRKVATNGIITTVAGGGATAADAGGGYGVTALQASLQNAYAIAIDPSNTIYIADASYNKIFRLINGVIYVAVGNGTFGYSIDPWYANSAEISISAYHGALSCDAAGDLFFADAYNGRIRKVTQGTYIFTVAGNGSYTFGGDGSIATNTGFNDSYSVASDSAGNFYIAGWDTRILKVTSGTPGTMTRYAGNMSGTYSGDGGPAVNAGLAVGGSGAGAMAADTSGNLYFSEYGRIRRIDAQTGIITTICGNGTAAFSGDGGPPLSASIGTPIGLAVDSTNCCIYIADAATYRVRKFTVSHDLMHYYPTVATAPAANPSPATGATTVLSVLGADDAGESNLTYTWAVTGTPPASVGFSANGTNAAKSTTATFTKAGSYGFEVTITNPFGLSVTRTIAETVLQTPTTVHVTPATASISQYASQQYAASCTDQFGNAIAGLSYAWSASGGGTINSMGRFTAGGVVGRNTVTASTGGRSATAGVVVCPATFYVGASDCAYPYPYFYGGISTENVTNSTLSVKIDGAINGQPVIYQSGTWSYFYFYAQQPLADGPHVVQATYSDSVGVIATASQNFVVDTSPPILAQLNVYDGYVFPDGDVFFTGYLTDPESGISYAYAFIDNQYYPIQPDATGFWSLYVPDLSDGTHLFQIYAYNGVWSYTSQTAHFAVGDMGLPMVWIESPANGAGVASPPILSGFYDGGPVNVYVNGSFVQRFDEEMGEFSCDPLITDYGVYSVTVFDDNWNMAQQPWTFTYVPPPVLQASVSSAAQVDFTFQGDPAYQLYYLYRTDGIYGTQLLCGTTSTSFSDTSPVQGQPMIYTLYGVLPDDTWNPAPSISVQINPQDGSISGFAPSEGGLASGIELTLGATVNWGNWPPLLLLDGASVPLNYSSYPSVNEYVYGLSDNVHSAGVVATDDSGDVEAYFWNFTTDGTPPQIAYLSPDGPYTYLTASTATLAIEDPPCTNGMPGSGVASIVVYDSNGYAVSFNTIDCGIELNGLPNGFNSYTVYTTDYAGNQSSLNWVFNVDLSNPSIAIQSPADQQGAVGPNVPLSGSFSGMYNYQIAGITVTIGGTQYSASPVWNDEYSGTFSVTATGLSAGEYSVDAVITSPGGMQSFASITIHVYNPPSVVLTSGQGSNINSSSFYGTYDNSSGSVWVSSASLSTQNTIPYWYWWYGGMGYDANGFNAFLLYVYKEWYDWDTDWFYANPQTWLSIPDGTYQLNLTFNTVDGYSFTTSQSITLDTQPPQFTCIQPQGSVTDGYTQTSTLCGTDAVLEITDPLDYWSNPGSGVNWSSLDIIDQGSDNTAYTSEVIDNMLVLHGLQPGNYRILVFVSDNAGNGSLVEWTFGAVAPVLTSIAISPAATTINVGASKQFTATGADQFGQPMSAAVSWSANGGAIDANGVLTIDLAAGAGPADVTAASDGITATAYLQIEAGAAMLKATVSTVNPSGEIDLTWISNSDNAGFSIERKDSPIGTYALLSSVGQDTAQFHDSTVLPNQTYSYRIQACNADGVLPYSNEAVAATPPVAGAAPAAPSNLAAVYILPTVVHLSWSDNSNNEREFRIERKGAGGIYSLIGMTTPNAAVFDDTVDAQFTYRVQATNASGVSAYSNEATPTVDSIPPPSFTNVTPVNDSWTGQARPVIGAHITGDSIDYSTLEVDLYLVDGNLKMAISGINPIIMGADFTLSLPDDLTTGTYSIDMQVANSIGQTVTATRTFHVDTTPPVISAMTGNANAGYSSISASFADADSGIASAVLMNGDRDITQYCTASPNSIDCQLSDVPNLSLYHFTLIVTDNVGNVATRSIGDTTRPAFGAADPAPGGFRSVPAGTGRLSIAYSDDFSGVDTSRVLLYIDDMSNAVDLPSGDVTPTGLTFDLASYADGPHTWKVKIWDKAGNGPEEFRSTFVLDSTPPSESKLQSESIVDTPLDSVVINLTDSVSGVDWSSLLVSVEAGNALLPATYTSHASDGSATLTLPAPISGSRTIHLDARDLAGNALHIDSVQTMALYGFKGQRPLNTWLPFDDNFIAEFDPSGLQWIEVSYANGIDPNSFSFNGQTLPDTEISVDEATKTIRFAIEADAPTMTWNWIDVSAPGGLTSFHLPCNIAFCAPSATPYIALSSPWTGGDVNCWTPIIVTVDDPSYALQSQSCVEQEVTILVDGHAILATASLNFTTLTLEFQPTAPWSSSNSHTIEITATNVFQQPATLPAQFTVAQDISAPVILPPGIGPYVPDARPAFEFLVDDDFGGTGVDDAYTAVSADGVNWVAATHVHDDIYSFTDPQIRANGAQITYIIRARDLAYNLADNVQVSLIVDLAPPEMTSLSLPEGHVDPATNQFSISADDVLSGVQSVTATLNGASLPQFDGPPDPWAFGISLLRNMRYHLDIVATDNVQNKATIHRDFIAANPNDPPVILIDKPLDGATVASLQGKVEIIDSGMPIDPAKITITFNDDPPVKGPLTLVPSGTYDAATGTLVLNFTMPSATPNGSYSIIVTAIDANNQSTSKGVQFTLNRPIPNQPTISDPSIGSQYITYYGHVDVDPNDPLASLNIIPSGAAITSQQFNPQTGDFTIILQNTGQPSAQIVISAVDAYGTEGPALTDNENFAAPPPGQSSGGGSSAPAVNAPDGAAGADSARITVYWDFDPNDITGVTKPLLTAPIDGVQYPPTLTTYRGWIPATKKTFCHVIGIVRGGVPPYSITVSGEGIDTVNQQIADASFNIQLNLSEGLKKNIKLSVEDAIGPAIKSFSRDLYADSIIPMVHAETDKWYFNSSENFIFLDSSCGNGIEVWGAWRDDPPYDFIKDERNDDQYPPQGSGIARIDLLMNRDENDIHNLAIIPRETEGDSYYIEGEFGIGSNDAWTAKVSIPRPEGKEGDLQTGDIYPLVLSDDPNALPGTYETLSFLMTLRAFDGAGNFQDLQGKFFPPIIPDLPSFVPLGQPLFLMAEWGQISGLSDDPLTFHEDPDQVVVLRRETEGIFDASVTTKHWSTDQETYEEYVDTKTDHIKVRVIAPHFLIDENNDGRTDDEDQDRQRTYGVIVPINDDFEVGTTGTPSTPDFASSGDASSDTGLRLVTFDKTLSDPRPDPNNYSDVAIRYITVNYSSNLRLWKTRNKTPENLIGSPDPDPVTKIVNKYSKTWDLTKDDDYADFNSMIGQSKGQFYVECLPDPESPIDGYPHSERRFIEWLPGADQTSAASVRLFIHGVSDNNAGRRTGAPRAPINDVASVELVSGALKCAWPAVRMGSPIIPDISVYYDSRDAIGGELNNRLLPFGMRKWLQDQPSSYANSASYYHDATAPGSSNGDFSSYLPVLDARLTDLRRPFRHTLEMRLIHGASKLVLIEGDGRRIEFTSSGDLSATAESDVIWRSDPLKGDFSTIKMVSKRMFGDQGAKYSQVRRYYVLLRPNENKQYVFEDVTGKLIEIRDVFNNVAKLEYEEYDGTRGRLKRVSDNLGNLVQFDSDENGNMTITGPSGAVSISDTGISGPLGNYDFTLNPNDRIVTFKNALGAEYTINPDDGSFADETTDVQPANSQKQDEATVSTTFGVVYSVRREKDQSMMTLEHRFKDQKSIVHNFKSGTDDPTTEYTYDARKGVWTSIKLPGGTITLQQSADDNGLIDSTTNQFQGTTSYTYDNGKLQSVLDSDGVGISSTAYTQENNTNYSSDGPNYIESFTLTAATQSSKGDSVGHCPSFDGTILTDVITSTDANSASAGSTYTVVQDRFGVQRIEGPKDGVIRTFTRDSVGRILSSTLEGAGIDANNCKTQYTTNYFGQPLDIQLPTGRHIKKWYDVFGRNTVTQGPLLADGEKSAAAAPDGGGADIDDGGSSGVFYDAAGNWIMMQDADGRTTTRSINEIGAVESVTAPSGTVTTFSDFDANLNPASAEIQATDDVKIQIDFEYDLLGRRTIVKVPRMSAIPGDGSAKRVYETVFDDAGKAVVQKDAAGNDALTQRFRPSGRIDATADVLRQAAARTYDLNGLTESITVPGFAAQTAVHDRNGAVTRSGMPDVSLVTDIQRDELGMARSVKPPGDMTITHVNDGLGRSTATSINSQQIVDRHFDPANPKYQFTPDKVTDTLTSALTQILSTDAHGRPAAWTTHETTPVTFSAVGGTDGAPGIAGVGPWQDVIEKCKYMNDGQALSLTDGNGKTIHPQYTSGDKIMTGVKDQAGVGGGVDLHLSGAVRSVTNDRGEVTKYIYDSDSAELKALLFGDGRGVQFEYDDNGNAIRETYLMAMDESGNAVNGCNVAPYVRYKEYDRASRVVRLEDPEGSANVTTYTYYNTGLLQSATDADGRTVKYSYDRAGRTTDVNGPGKRHTHTDYAANGKIAQVTYSDGRVEKYCYDNFNRLAAKTVTGQGKLTYHYNDAQDMDSVTDGNGYVVNFTYDNQHRCVKTSLPGGKNSSVGYDPAGFAIRMSDAMGHEFALRNLDNGLRSALSVVNGNQASDLLTYTYDGYTPTSDGTMHWTLDQCGRVASSDAETFEYNHPLGLMTKKSYAGAELTYAYDTANGQTPFLQSMTDAIANNSVTFGRSAAGVLNAETYGNGIVKSYTYNGDMDITGLAYTKDQTTLASFTAGFAAPGRRSSLTIAPSGEAIAFGYDAGLRLTSEMHAGGGGNYTIGYTYDNVGTRLTRTISGKGADTYAVNARYELTSAKLADGSRLDYVYDDNGNTLQKTHTITATIVVSYKNINGKKLTYHVKNGDAAGQTLDFAPTGDQFKTVLVSGVSLGGTIGFCVTADEVSSDTISIESLTVRGSDGTSHTYLAQAAAISNTVSLIDDNEAASGKCIADFGNSTNDSIAWGTNTIGSETYTYEWDALNYMTAAHHKYEGIADDADTAQFQRGGGWQAGSITVNSETRNFSYGFDGSILSETTPTNGTRTYVNAGIDHIMWSMDTNGTKYWLGDVNGSEYGVTNAAGSVFQRQTMDAFGNVTVTEPNASLESWVDFQGFHSLPGFKDKYGRHRNLDTITGRWYSRDPLGMVNGPNVYGFCGGDPANRTDPMGTDFGDILGGIWDYLTKKPPIIDMAQAVLRKWDDMPHTNPAFPDPKRDFEIIMEYQRNHPKGPPVTIWEATKETLAADVPSEIREIPKLGVQFRRGEITSAQFQRKLTKNILCIGEQAFLITEGMKEGEVYAAEAETAPELLPRSSLRPLPEPIIAPNGTQITFSEPGALDIRLSSGKYIEPFEPQFGGTARATQGQLVKPLGDKRMNLPERARVDAITDIAQDPDYGRYSNQGGGPYSHLPDVGKVEPYRRYSTAQRKAILDENASQNAGKLVSETGAEIPDRSRAHIDHDTARSKGGENSNDNARVLLDIENLKKGAN